MITEERKQAFLELLWEHYRQRGRHDLPWRIAEPDGQFDPYKIMVSELMLQQTQVSRVIPKYEAFLAQFPTAKHLAQAELGAVLRAWQGLGYNRRAKFLWQASQRVAKEASFPSSLEELVALPGVGANTAGAIMAYAWNKPVVFIETNIRTVIIHHFAPEAQNVSDSFIREVVNTVLDVEHPREFYWALMDYGAFIKTQVRNNSQSKHYAKQSSFQGSRRQVRGKVLRLLADHPHSLSDLETEIADERLGGVLAELVAEELIRQAHGVYDL